METRRFKNKIFDHCVKLMANRPKHGDMPVQEKFTPWVATAYAPLVKPAAEMTVTELKEFLQSHGIAGNARKERLVKCAQLLTEDVYMALNNETLLGHHPTPSDPVTLVRLRSLDELERIADGFAFGNATEGALRFPRQRSDDRDAAAGAQE